MKDDKTMMTYLWYLHKNLARQFEGKEYRHAIYEDLDIDTCRSIDELVAHIKENY